MKTIGWIGVGVMGSGMISNLLQSGFSVQIYSRTRSKCAEVEQKGALWKDSIAQCVSGCDVVITMLGYPQDVKEVYFGENGILNCGTQGSYLIDMTTTSPTLSKEIYQLGKQKGFRVLDAPVSGGDSGARAGTLAIMVGGEKEDYDACMPIFSAMGKNIVYEGVAGNGQHTKMANQIALAGALAGVCEAMTYGKSVGLDVQTMLDTISTGAAGSWQMSNLAPKMLKENFDPGFYLKHYVKDMSIAQQESEEISLQLGVLNAVKAMFDQLQQEGMGDEGTQALIKYYLGEHPFEQ